MISDVKDTASLLGSRICHDLISPLGAINNGLELLLMSGVAKSPEMALIEESIANANARVRLFRVAFGAASGGQVMARADVVGLIKDCYDGGRFKIHWDAANDPTRTEVKIGFLSILCMEVALPQGGEISVSNTHGDWTIRAYGPKIRFDEDVWNIIQGGPVIELAASMVQFVLLRDSLAALRRSVQVGHSDTAVSLRY